jgi:hypothetical protein
MKTGKQVLLLWCTVSMCLPLLAESKDRLFWLQKIGSFHALSKGDKLDESIYIPDGVAHSILGLSVEGASYSHPGLGRLALATNLSAMRLKILLFHSNSVSDFYRVELPLATNSAYYSLWMPDFGVLLGGIEPFPYAWQHTKSNSVASFQFGRDVFPLKDGQLISHLSYRIKLIVEAPVTVTNRLQLWLYSVPE